MEPIVTCRGLKKSFVTPQHTTKVIRGIDLTLERGIFYSIIGKSGSGKSTLLYLLSGILAPDEGEICFDGRPLSAVKGAEKERLRRQKMGFVFQDYQLLPELSVRENILLPQVLDGRSIEEAWIDGILDKLELTHRADYFPAQLSGGEQQRTAIGRALVNRPEILFADEPTGDAKLVKKRS